MGSFEHLMKLSVEFNNKVEAGIRATKALIKEADLSDEELLEYIDIYPSWSGDGVEVKVDELYKFEGDLYRVFFAHTTQEDWIPSEEPSLFIKVVPEGIIPEWVQPEGYHDAYQIGDIVTYEGETYENMIKDNTYPPDEHGWKEIEEAE